MAVEYRNRIPQEALDPYTNPNACEATVEVEVFSQYRRVQIAGTEISCAKCNVHQRFGNVGTEAEISKDVQGRVVEVTKAYCLKLRASGQNISPELLPQARLL